MKAIESRSLKSFILLECLRPMLTFYTLLDFCDREGLRVLRVNLDGSQLETLVRVADWQKEPEKVKDQTNWCVGIAVSPKNGKFYWTQKGPSKGSQGRIFSANIDFPKGEDAVSRKDIELVIGQLPEPIDLELNEDESVLFWSDRGELPLGKSLARKKQAPRTH